MDDIHWNSICMQSSVYSSQPACFDTIPSEYWIKHQSGFHYVVRQMPDYNLNNTHMHGEFYQCEDCKSYYSGVEIRRA